MLRRWLLALLLASCGSDRAEPTATSADRTSDLRGSNGGAAADETAASSDASVQTAVRDAGAADAVSAALVHRCNARMSVKGWLQVRIDETTREGTIQMVTAGKALTRHIHVTAKPNGTELTLVFDHYDRADHSTIRGVRKPRPARERLTKGTSIVARMVTVSPGLAHLYVDGDVDWTTDTFLVVQNGYAECPEATADPP